MPVALFLSLFLLTAGFHLLSSLSSLVPIPPLLKKKRQKGSSSFVWEIKVCVLRKRMLAFPGCSLATVVGGNYYGVCTLFVCCLVLAVLFIIFWVAIGSCLPLREGLTAGRSNSFLSLN